jgi:hypothetical protein
MTSNPALKTKGAGNAFWLKQIKLNSAGDGFEAYVGTDCFGSVAGTWHSIGTLSKSPIDRQSDCSHKVVLSVLEDDTTRKRFLINAAPATAGSTDTPPDYNSEDGSVKFGGSTGSSMNTERPIFSIAKREAKTGDPEEFFLAVAQFDPAGKRPNQFNTYNEKDITCVTIDGLGYTEGTLPSDDTFDDVTGVALEDASKFGDFVVATP